MVDYGLEIIEKGIRERLLTELTRTGIIFRLFSRIKEQNSIEEKFVRKSYKSSSKLMQDLIGFRITTYFYDDLKIIVDLCKKIFEKVELIYDEPSSEVFRPLRKNMICKMPLAEAKTFNEIKPNNPNFEFIDNTFEIQFRTTLSEGWHEVDHLMRYKCKEEWITLDEENRMLNGIYATLETNDLTLKALFDDIAYKHYKSKQWEAMLRNKLRLRFMLQKMDSELIEYLNNNPNLGKTIFKINRNKILNSFINSTIKLPITFDNLLYLINYLFLKDSFIFSKTPSILLNEFELGFENQ